MQRCYILYQCCHHGVSISNAYYQRYLESDQSESQNLLLNLGAAHEGYQDLNKTQKQDLCLSVRVSC